jgi:hypothetical protein
MILDKRKTLEKKMVLVLNVLAEGDVNVYCCAFSVPRHPNLKLLD